MTLLSSENSRCFPKITRCTYLIISGREQLLSRDNDIIISEDRQHLSGYHGAEEGIKCFTHVLSEQQSYNLMVPVSVSVLLLLGPCSLLADDTLVLVIINLPGD